MWSVASSEMSTDGIESRLGTQRIAIPHRPQIAGGYFHGTTQSRAKVGEPIELPPRGLAPAALDGSEVITVDGRRACSDSASRPLVGSLSYRVTRCSGVTSGDTISSRLNCDATWNSAPALSRDRCMRPYIACHHTDLETARQVACGFCPFAESLKWNQF
jgi:hypothetical protein